MDDAKQALLGRVLKVLAPQVDHRGRRATSVRPYYNERWAAHAVAQSQQCYDSAEPVVLKSIGINQTNKTTRRQQWYQGMQYAVDHGMGNAEMLVKCIAVRFSGGDVVLYRTDAEMGHVVDWRGRCDEFRCNAAIGDKLQLFALQLTPADMEEIRVLFMPSTEFTLYVDESCIRVVRIT